MDQFCVVVEVVEDIAHKDSQSQEAVLPAGPRLANRESTIAAEVELVDSLPGPLVSVVIPTYNRSEMLSRALRSVASQTYRNFEVIVVDDGSTDDTAEMMTNFPDVQYLKSEHGGGGHARNVGIRVARGEYVAFLDSDDEWLPRKLERQVEVFGERPALGVVYCSHYGQDELSGVIKEAQPDLLRGWILQELLGGRFPLTISLFVIRRSMLEDIGGFDEALPGFQDADLLIRLAEVGEFDAVDQALAIIHAHEGPRVTTSPNIRADAIDLFLEKWGGVMADAHGGETVDAFRRAHHSYMLANAVLVSVGAGQRMAAIAILGRYLLLTRGRKPSQAAGLVTAILGGIRSYEPIVSLARRLRSTFVIHPGLRRPNWTIYDVGTTGHHPVLSSQIALAAHEEGLGVLAASSLRPTFLGTEGISWLNVASYKRRELLVGRKVMRDAVKGALLAGSQVFLDLFFDVNIWMLPRCLSRIPVRFHVIHHATQYSYESRSPVGKIITAVARAFIRRLVSAGAHIVVHTESAREILQDLVSEDHLTCLPYPLVGESHLEAYPPLDEPPAWDPPRLAFVGPAREDKGFNIFYEALEQWQGEPLDVTIVGQQETEVRRRYESDPCPNVRLRWVDQYVPYERLINVYQESTLIIVPYTSRYGHHGGASGVLLEALAFGAPIVTTTALAPQLPEGYEGALIVANDDPGAMAKGIASALQNIESLRDASRHGGPSFIRARHTYEAYVRRLRAIAEADS